MKKKVMAFGTFDILHPGHIAYLQFAKRQGDILVVVISHNSTATRVKGKEPLFSARERKHMVESLACVDRALLGDARKPYTCISKERPDCIVLGYDQKEFVKGLYGMLKAERLQPRIIRSRAHRSKHYKSSHIKRYLYAQH